MRIWARVIGFVPFTALLWLGQETWRERSCFWREKQNTQLTLEDSIFVNIKDSED